MAERDENTARKEMLPTEAALLGMAIEEMEKPAAQARLAESHKRAADTRWGNAPGHRSPSASESRPHDIAAEAVGLTRGTYVNIKTAITVARNEEEPQHIRDVALFATLVQTEGGDTMDDHRISRAPQLLKVADVARRLGVGTDWVYDRINRGEIPVVELGDTRKNQRIRESDLAEFIDDRTYGERSYSA